MVPRFLYLMSHRCYRLSIVLLTLLRCEFRGVRTYVFATTYRLAVATHCNAFLGLPLTHPRDCKNIAAWQRRKRTTEHSGFEWTRISSRRSNASRPSLTYLCPGAFDAPASNSFNATTRVSLVWSRSRSNLSSRSNGLTRASIRVKVRKQRSNRR